ncbi:MAG: hypothetical protein SFH39_00460 [Candidatus Magnetobacterium sp. LHC-1]
MPYKDIVKRNLWYAKRRKTKAYKEYQKKFRKEHGEYFKKWRDEHRETCRAATEAWRQRNKEHEKLSQRMRRKKFPWESHYYAAKSRCCNKKMHNYHRYGGRGIKFLLTIKEVKILWDEYLAMTMVYPTIDRINNDGNYELSNCRFIEMKENISKSNKERMGK